VVSPNLREIPSVREPQLKTSAIVVYAMVRDDADWIAFGRCLPDRKPFCSSSNAIALSSCNPLGSRDKIIKLSLIVNAAVALKMLAHAHNRGPMLLDQRFGFSE
jgi:hypothetical protein